MKMQQPPNKGLLLQVVRDSRSKFGRHVELFFASLGVYKIFLACRSFLSQMEKDRMLRHWFSASTSSRSYSPTVSLSFADDRTLSLADLT